MSPTKKRSHLNHPDGSPTLRGERAMKQALAVGVVSVSLELWLAIALIRSFDVDLVAVVLGGLALFGVHWAVWKRVRALVPAWRSDGALRLDRIACSYVVWGALAGLVALVHPPTAVSVLAGSLLWAVGLFVGLTPVAIFALGYGREKRRQRQRARTLAAFRPDGDVR